MVLGFLRPTDQQCAVAVEPGVAGLDDPAASAPAGCQSFQLALLAAAADLGGVATRGDEVADPRVGVAAVEAELERILGRSGRLDRNRVERRG